MCQESSGLGVGLLHDSSKGWDEAEAGKETEQTQDTGASPWSSLPLCTPFQAPWIRSFDCRGTCCLSQSFAMCPLEDAGSAPSPHRSAPTSLSHTCQGGSIHSERWSQGSPWLGLHLPAHPNSSFPYPLPLLPSFHDVTSRHCPDTPCAPPAVCFSAS